MTEEMEWRSDKPLASGWRIRRLVPRGFESGCYRDDWESAVPYIKRNGVLIVPSTIKASPVDSLKAFIVPVGFVCGCEVTGLFADSVYSTNAKFSGPWTWLTKESCYCILFMCWGWKIVKVHDSRKLGALTNLSFISFSSPSNLHLCVGSGGNFDCQALSLSYLYWMKEGVWMKMDLSYS